MSMAEKTILQDFLEKRPDIKDLARIVDRLCPEQAGYDPVYNKDCHKWTCLECWNRPVTSQKAFRDLQKIRELIARAEVAEAEIEQLRNEHLKIQYHNEELTVQEICERLERAEKMSSSIASRNRCTLTACWSWRTARSEILSAGCAPSGSTFTTPSGNGSTGGDADVLDCRRTGRASWRCIYILYGRAAGKAGFPQYLQCAGTDRCSTFVGSCPAGYQYEVHLRFY